ncbi:MAG TPA: DUF2975 domain-containing protein [Rhizomicrobium sp.]|nr:DUF2975 domain-containing protein [Rhizomicrobium sp.]
MADVLDFPQSTVAPIEAPRRLMKLSRALSLLFAVLIALSLIWTLGAAVVAFIFPDHALIGAQGVWLEFPHPPQAHPGFVVFASQPFVTRLAGFVDVVIAIAPLAAVCWHLRALFALYARGIVFAHANATHLKRVGLWLLAYPAAKLAANLLFRAFGGTDTAWAQAALLYALLLGAVVTVIAQVMELGREIEEEKDSFV